MSYNPLMETALAYLMQPALGKPLWAWGLFLIIVFLLLAFDLGVLNRRDEEISFKKSLWLSLGYISIALLYGIWVWVEMGQERGLDFYTGYLIEKSLSVDNIFVMSVIFAYFKIPRIYQHRVLFWGILGALVMRGGIIWAGAALVERFHWVLLIFGAFLVFTGIKMLMVSKDEEHSVENSRLIRFMEKHIRFTTKIHGNKFFIHEKDSKTGKLARTATPLFLALVSIEFADIIFAVDSIPAVFAVTTDTYVVYTSNIFAILGLRALYFLLAAAVSQFRYLEPAVSLVLIFIGGKVFYSFAFEEKVSSLFSLGVTLGVLATGLLMSLLKGDGKKG